MTPSHSAASYLVQSENGLIPSRAINSDSDAQYLSDLINRSDNSINRSDNLCTLIITTAISSWHRNHRIH